MKIEIPKTGELSRETLEKYEREIGVKFPKDYFEFLLNHNGAHPPSNTFVAGKNISGGVAQFIPIDKIIGFRDKTEGFSKEMLPIACDDGGNYVYLDPANGNIYYWDHEIQNNDYKLANNFAEFLSLLESFDLDQIKLKPGQVKSVWIDPSFLADLKKTNPGIIIKAPDFVPPPSPLPPPSSTPLRRKN